MKNVKMVNCPICQKEVKSGGLNGHVMMAHGTKGAALEDSSKLKSEIVVLNDSVKAKDTEIAQLQDSLTKSDAAFLTVKAELADAISYEHERAIVVDFLDKLTPEGKTALSERLGLAELEDSAELGESVSIETIHESLVNGQREQMFKQIKRYGLGFWLDYEIYLEEQYPEDIQTAFNYFADAVKSYFNFKGKGKMKDSAQDGAEAARDAHNVEVVGSIPTPATTPEETAPVADVIPEESPGEKWWREFQANLNK